MSVAIRKKSAQLGETPSSEVIITNLDALYSAKDIGPWLHLSERTVLDLARRGRLPCVRFNERVLRFHPRTILASQKGIAA